MNTIYFVAKIYYNDINYTKLVGLYNNINDTIISIINDLPTFFHPSNSILY